jgi:hypothetical protein
MHMIRRILHPHHTDCDEPDCKQQRLKEVDRRMDEQDSRLMALEFEAYGGRHPMRRASDRHDH